MGTARVVVEQMAKTQTIEIMKVPVEIEYEKPILGRIYWFFVRLKLIRLARVNMTLSGRIVGSILYLCIPVSSRRETQ